MLSFKIPHHSSDYKIKPSDKSLTMSDEELEEKEYTDIFTQPIHELVAGFVDKTEPKNEIDTPEQDGEPVEYEDLKFMNPKTLRIIYYDLGGTDNVSKLNKLTLLKKIEGLRKRNEVATTNS